MGMTLEITNCENCGIDILTRYRLCDVCIEKLNEKDLLKRQQNLWKRYIYYPWKRAIITEWQKEVSITITPT